MKQNKLFNSQNSKEWLSSLLSYFINIKSIDENIESLRVSLCSQIDFTPHQLFQYLDKRNKDFLLLNDFVLFLNELHIPFEEKYLRKFIHNFDKDSDFSLNFQEFLGLIIPKKSNDLKYKVLSNRNNYDVISKNTKDIFGKLLCEELELVKNCIKTAKFCRKSMGFTCYESFIEIAGNDKYITEKHLYNFLQRNNINISNNDMHQLMFRLDADDDGRISFNEFKEIFVPSKEGNLNYKNNILPETDYNFYTLSFSKNNEEIPKKSSKNNNIFDYTFRQNKNAASNLDNLNNKLKEIIIEDNNNSYRSTSNIIREKNYNYYAPDNKRNAYSNKIFSQTQKIYNSYNKLPVLNDDESYNNKQGIYMTELSDTDKIFSSTFNKTIDFVSPIKLIRKRLENSSSYKSPKIKHTKNPLHYDYSTYSNEDGDEYYRRKRFRQSAKTERNINYRVYKNITINTDNNIEISNKNLKKLCCGCPMYDPQCPCPSDAGYRNCICPKAFNKNSGILKSSYLKKFDDKINNSSNGFKSSMNSRFFKNKPNFNFLYTDENENEINVRKFDENRLLSYK